MLIKQRKINTSSIVWISLLVLITILLFSNKIIKHQNGISLGDYIQKFMSLNLGFSSLTNLVDSEEDWNSTSTELKALISSIPKIVKYNLINHNPDKFERLDITIDFSDYLTIYEDRKKAISNLVLSKPTKVNAKLHHKGIEYKASLRLKGDNPSHWYNTPRLSFRVNLKNKKTIFGFSTFSIQKPKERLFPYAYIYDSLIQDMGNISPAHKFTHIFVNGEDWGIMNIEEHFSKELLEKQNKKESAIIRFGNDEILQYKNNSERPYQHYRLSDSILYTHLYNDKNTHNRKIHSYILKSRLTNNASYIYDVDSFTKSYIMTVIWGNNHVLNDPNTKYYFNPYTLKLEPITTDQLAWHLVNEQWLEDFIVPTVPIQYIEVMRTKSYAENLPRNLEIVRKTVSNINKHLTYSQSLFPVDKKKSTKTIKDNIKKILDNKEYYLMSLPEKWEHMKNDTPKESLLPTKQQASEFMEHLHIRHFTDGNLELYNLLPDNVTVKNVLFNGKSISIKDIVVPSYL